MATIIFTHNAIRIGYQLFEADGYPARHCNL